MAVKKISDLDNGAPSDLGGDDTIDIDSVICIEASDGSATRKISIRDFLGFLGFNVGTESEINAVITARADPMMAFITNGRKSNHVQGSGTMSESSSNGTGLLATYVSPSDVEGVDDGSDVTV